MEVFKYTVQNKEGETMMKRVFLFMLTLSMCLCLTACGSNTNTDTKSSCEDNTQKTEETVADVVNSEADDETGELAVPVMEWWELYNPNGFDTFTAVITNPNSVAIDVSYDLVYYKGGKETARNESFANFSILPGREDIIWANYDIPKSTDVDEVKMENVVVTETSYEPIDGKYEYVGTTDGEAFFDFTFDSKPTLASITFLLYNDNNQNGQFDKGEIVVTSTTSLMEQTGRVSLETDVYSYTDYEVFFTAY